MRRLKNRSEFLGAARGKRVGRSAFSLQANARAIEEPGVGFTVTKQTGNNSARFTLAFSLILTVILGAKLFGLY